MSVTYTGATCSCFHMFRLESAVSVCDIRVHTINFGCHLEWNCPDANPKTTYTVLSKTHGWVIYTQKEFRCTWVTEWCGRCCLEEKWECGAESSRALGWEVKLCGLAENHSEKQSRLITPEQIRCYHFRHAVGFLWITIEKENDSQALKLNLLFTCFLFSKIMPSG